MSFITNVKNESKIKSGCLPVGTRITTDKGIIPIEKIEVSIVEIDSTFEGYVIKAHIQGTDQGYTDGKDMRAFLGTWGHSWPDKSELLQRNTK